MLRGQKPSPVTPERIDEVIRIDELKNRLAALKRSANTGNPNHKKRLQAQIEETHLKLNEILLQEALDGKGFFGAHCGAGPKEAKGKGASYVLHTTSGGNMVYLEVFTDPSYTITYINKRSSGGSVSIAHQPEILTNETT